MRHLDLKYQWIQSLVKSGRLIIYKVPGVDNVADIGTKSLGKELFNKHRQKLGLIDLKDQEQNNIGAITLDNNFLKNLLVAILTGHSIRDSESQHCGWRQLRSCDWKQLRSDSQ